LNFSNEKTHIIHLKKNKAKFLGFEFSQSASYIPFLKKDVNPLKKIDKIKMNWKYRVAIFQTP